MPEISELYLSTHFRERWRERVGGEPKVSAVRKLINESVYLQQCQMLRLHSGGFFCMPGIYWHPEKNIIIKLDEIEKVAITVLSPRCIMEEWEADGIERPVFKSTGR